MTENKRIFWNIVATYGRSVYSIVIGLLCGRWALMVLGTVDYGLLGLIGGMSGVISMLNWIIAATIARFYGISVGAARVAEDKAAALEECRHWFNSALVIHTVVPTILILIGYPMGIWAIENFLEIPAARVSDCVCVFRFICISCFFSMAGIPYNAMYQAKQYIAELTIYSFITQTLYVCYMYYMLRHPGDWMLIVAMLGCASGVIPQFIIAIRACRIFPECKVVPQYMLDWSHLRQMLCFSGWQLIDTINTVVRNNGKPILINKFFGAAMNASFTIGNTVQGHCNSLAAAMQGAFTPVITQAYGAGELEKLKVAVIRSSKFNVVMTMLFVIPLALELPEVMRLWLETPPDYTICLCGFAMVINFMLCCTTSHHTAIYATGSIALYNSINCINSIIMILAAAVVGFITRGIVPVMCCFAFFAGTQSIIRLLFAQKLANIPIKKWLKDVVVRPIVVGIATVISGVMPRLFMEPCFIRVCVTTFFCLIVFLPILWLVLSADERLILRERLFRKLRLFHA